MLMSTFSYKCLGPISFLSLYGELPLINRAFDRLPNQNFVGDTLIQQGIYLFLKINFNFKTRKSSLFLQEIIQLLIQLGSPYKVCILKDSMHFTVHSSTIYHSQVLEATYVPISKWVYPKTMVYLHNRILCSREKEGAYTLCNSMDGTGEHYAKWNKQDGEGQIPYDLTFNWNIINRRKKQTKYNQRHWS